jgi:lysozyme
MTDQQTKANQFKKIAAACGLSGAIAATSLLMPFEGKVNKTYLDPIGLYTSCYGHLDPTSKLGTEYTDDQCDAQLIRDIQIHDQQLISVVTEKMNPYEHAAYLSFVFNVGIENFRKSTMLGKLNAGNHAGACDEFIRWTYAGKQQLQGLVRRREAERDMCLGKTKPDKALLDEIK